MLLIVNLKLKLKPYIYLQSERKMQNCFKQYIVALIFNSPLDMVKFTPGLSQIVSNIIFLPKNR